MMVRFLNVIGREVRGMHEAAYLLAAFSLGSQILALVRDRLLATAFGAGHTLDMYYAAFRAPDFIFATVASLFSLYALLPILSRLEKEEGDYMISFLRGILVLFFAGMAVIATIVFWFAPALAPIIAPGITTSPAENEQFILLMRILLLQPILLGASNTIAALTQLRHRFVLYSVGPLLYNFGIIFGAVYLFPRIGLSGLGWGVVLGAFLHLLVQLPFFLAEKPKLRLPLSRVFSGALEVLKLSVPRTFALATTQITLLVLVAIASILAPGSIAIFTFAFNLQAVPLTIIGVSYSVAAFPTLARLHATGEKKAFTEYIEAALRHMIFWAIPAIVFIIVLRAQLVRLILGAGAFDWVATRLTAAALALLVLSLVAQSIALLIARAYYAVGNTSKPLYWGVLDVLVSVSSALFFVFCFHQSAFLRAFVESLLRVSDVPGTAVLMLALGYTFGSVVKFIVGYTIFSRDFSIQNSHIYRLGLQSFAASVIGGAVAYSVLFMTGGLLDTHTVLAIILEGGSAGVVGLCTTLGVLYMLKNQELFESIAMLRKYVGRAPTVAVEPSDIAS